MAGQAYTTEEFLAVTLAHLCEGARTVAVGNSSAIPAAAGLLYSAKSSHDVVLSILGSFKYGKVFCGGILEHYDFAARGLLDVQFFSGGEIDGHGNINLVGVGGYPDSAVRFAGSFGSGLQYYIGKRTILFRQEHSRRVLVPDVEFISAPGYTSQDVYRLGGPVALVTGLCVMSFDALSGRFKLVSTHPGVSVDEVADNTGFDFDVVGDGCGAAITSEPTSAELGLLRTFVKREVAEVYPTFAANALLETVP